MADKVAPPPERSAFPPERTLLQRAEDFERWRAGRPGRVHDDALRLHRPRSSADEEERTVLPPEWRPAPLPERKRPRRRVRWSFILFVIALAAGALAVLQVVPGIAEDRAEQRAQEYRSDLLELEASIPAFATAGLAIADPTTPPEGRVGSQPALTRFQSAAIGLIEATREPLPTTPPLVPRDVIEELQPLRAELTLVAGRADLIATRVLRYADYRAGIDGAFVLPSLPAGADAEVNDLTLALAGMRADTLGILSSLPTDAGLDVHRAAVQELLQWFDDWEVRYLTAVRRGDDAAAGALAEEATTRITGMRSAIGAALAELQVWMLDELDGLREDITAARVQIP